MHEENQSAEMKQFEAALAALTPRTDRLDRDRLMFLAGQQSILIASKQKSPLPTNLRFVPGDGQGEGGTIARPIRSRTLAWPAAFAAMTVVAAALLVMLVVRPGSKDAENVVKYPASQSALATDAQETTASNDYTEQPRKYRTYFDLAFLSGADNRKIGEADPSHSNAALLRQILAKGVDSWKPRETGA
ncbi:MAG: hypothetical protein ABSA77_12140, partial [Thermoguttaceae bacterium]